jgi:hypothetical protein
LVEVARAAEVLGYTGAIAPWFAEYTTWMNTHEYGKAERDAKNNHGTCWVMQVAAFARLTGDQEMLEYCRTRFKTVLLPNQLAKDGSFPQELRRTKPYGYSLFNLEAMGVIAQLLSTPSDHLWNDLRKAVDYMVPYIRDKKKWPLPPDVMYFDQWPMRQSVLLFAGLAFDDARYIDLWKTLPADSKVEETIRNFFIRQPVLWVE